MMHHTCIAGAPDLLALHAAEPQRYPFLLQSVAGHPQSGRYDLLLAFPEWESAQTVNESPQFFSQLSAVVAAGQNAPPAELQNLPFIGGWFVFLAYEAACYIEPSLQLPANPFALPTATAVYCPAVIAVDRESKTTTIISQLSATQLELMADDLAVYGRSQLLSAEGHALATQIVEDPEALYLNGVAKVLEYLAAGDSFQVNLSRAWRANLRPDVTAALLYQNLRTSNPAPFAGLAQFKDAAVISSSPERLISFDGANVQTRPIAGTRRRGANEAEDQVLQTQLVGNLKERAEHVMLIDLERNDLGRVCQAGSVQVSELMRLESYAHVHHIVSNIQGRLRPDVGVGEAIAAVFPGGTITGCPKLRTMQIIAELEGVGRGAYTGAMGYISTHGKADLNILIRSLVLQDGQVTLRAGAGIVADSIAEHELTETRTKAKGLLKAFGMPA